jgi:hypothetical protein
MPKSKSRKKKPPKCQLEKRRWGCHPVTSTITTAATVNLRLAAIRRVAYEAAAPAS